jgi:hypothetical protein
MAFRDDHEAALARAEALERELAAERDRAAAAAARVADLERENRRLRDGGPPEPPSAEPVFRGPIPVAPVVGLIFLVLLVGLVAYFAMREPRTRQEDELRQLRERP